MKSRADPLAQRSPIERRDADWTAKRSGSFQPGASTDGIDAGDAAERLANALVPRVNSERKRSLNRHAKLEQLAMRKRRTRKRLLAGADDSGLISRRCASRPRPDAKAFADFPMARNQAINGRGIDEDHRWAAR